MKINIPKVIVPIEMGEYADELAGKFLLVWVNPPMKEFEKHTALLLAESKNGAMSSDLLNWYANIWSQGAADTCWTLEEIREIENDDPAFLNWMISATWQARREHMDRKKKV